jgi:hypothetical protein
MLEPLVQRNVDDRSFRVVTSADEFDAPALKVIHRAHDLDLFFLLESGENATLVSNDIDRARDVSSRNCIHEITVLAGSVSRVVCGRDCRRDLFEQARQVAKLHSIDRPFYGPAGAVAHDENQLGPSRRARKLQAAEHIVVSDVSRNARPAFALLVKALRQQS